MPYKKAFRTRAVRRSRPHCLVEALESRVLLSANIVPTFARWSIHGITPAAASSPSGISPQHMRTAYAIDQAVFGAIVGDGTGQTIAIVDAYNQPNIASDLAAFDAYYGFAAPPSLTVVGQVNSTLPAADVPGGWGVEITLDVEWAHVVAPNANILLVEANSSSTADLYAGVDRARNYAGVSVVSMSWGSDETSGDSSLNSHFLTPSGHIPVTFVASSGDTGAYGLNSKTTKVVGYPASSVNVLGVGGTYLTGDSNGNYVSESGWGNGTLSYSGSLGGSGGGGGGISVFSQPSYQSGIVTAFSSTQRTVPDVAFDADPLSGVSVYDTYDNGTVGPWATYGGTSLAAPMWAGVIAIADQGRVLNGLTTLDGATATLPKIYALPASDFHDVTTGNNGYAAGPGYDLVTGRGTPIVNLVVNDLAATPGPTISSFTVNPGTTSIGSTVTLSANALEIGGTISNVKFYLESNGTAGLQVGSDTLIGTGSSSGNTFNFALTTSSMAAGTYTYYAVATDVASVTTTASAALVLTTPVPSIGSFTITPGSSVIGGTVTLSATGVAETNGTINTVDFYRESNSILGVQAGSDTFVGSGIANGTTYTLSIPTAGFAVGTYTYYVIASDTVFSTTTATTSLTLVTPNPVIGGFSLNPGTVVLGSSSTLTATGVAEASGSISNVNFYLESNGTAGLQIGSDTLLGSAASSGTTFTLSTPTSGFAVGTYTYYAVATDFLGNTVTASAPLIVNAPSPTIGSFTINPASTVAGGSVVLSANSVTETNGSIASVKFYRESNAIGGLQTNSDTLVGTGTVSGTTWTFSPSTAGFAVGTYTYYAIAADPAGVTATATAILTITNPTSPFTAAWDVYGQSSSSSFGTQGLLATTVTTGATNTTGLTRGSGLTTPSGQSIAGGWGAESWGSTSAAAITGNQFITFAFTVSSGYALSLANLALNYRVANAAGPPNVMWQYQINSSGWNLISDTTNAFTITQSGGVLKPLNLSTVAGLQNIASGSVVAFRLIPYGGSGIHTFYVWHLGSNTTTNDLTLTGTASTLSGISPAANFGLTPTAAGTYSLATTNNVTLTTDLSLQGAINLNVNNGTTTLSSTEHLTSLTIAAGAFVTMAGISGALLDVSNLTIAATGKLNLAGNSLLVTASNIAAIRDYLKSGQIYSSNSNTTTTLAYLRGIDYTNYTGLTSLDGQAFNANDLLVIPAKVGDTNLDGTLNIDDYLTVDDSMLAPPSTVTWLSGDFTYDGTISSADYAILDAAYTLQQNPPLVPAVFPNWAQISVDIAKIGASAGPLANASVINFGTTVYTGPLNVINTISRIRADNGPNRTNDGIVNNDNNGTLLPLAGTWYEFTIDPATGTNIDFSNTVAFPGPMRLMLDDIGDLYYTGDHYVTFIPVYRASLAGPSISTFSVNPASVGTGSSITLTASGVTDSVATLSSLNFYLESNSTAGLQTGSDALIGTGTSSGTTFSFTTTAPTVAGTYTYYAYATDASALTTTAIGTLIVTGPAAPNISTFTVSPSSTVNGAPITLTASGVTAGTNPLASVKFYLESNGTAGLQASSDTPLVGTVTSSGSTFSLSTTAPLSIGTYTLYALATDSAGLTTTASATLIISVAATTPSIGSFTITPTSTTPGLPVTFTASNVSETGGSISSVAIYLETNGLAGLEPGIGTGFDSLIGYATQSGTTWTLTANAPTFAGTFQYYAYAIDPLNQSASATTTLGVTNPVTTGTLLSWDVNGLSAYGPQGFASDVTVPGESSTTGLTRGSGVTTINTASASTWGGNGWSTTTSAAGINGSQYITFGLTVAPGYLLSFSSLDLYYKKSATGPTNGYWQYQINGGTWNLIADVASQFTSTSGAAISALNLATFAALQNITSGSSVLFRLTPYGASSTGGNFYIANQTGNDLVIKGSTITLAGVTPLANISLSSPTAGTYILHAAAPITISSDLSLQGTISLDVAANTAVTLTSGQHLSALTIAAGATVTLPTNTHLLLTLQSLTIAATGKLDLGSNALDLTASNLTVLRGLLQTGQVYSSRAIPSVTTLGYLTGTEFSTLNAPGTQFVTDSVNPTDLLIKYTYVGDTDLDGRLTFDDILRVDRALSAPPAIVDWYSGDFNFNGTINAIDDTLINAAYLQQSANPLP